MKKWFLILMILALLVSSAAAQENEVVPLPTVAPLLVETAEPAADYSTSWLKEYYAESAMEGVDYQAPHMTAEESERAKKLLEDYQTGTRPAENVLDKLENVVVGVYTLKADDYAGEALYVLLPVTPLTDEQILEVIDAFAQCGQTFDPAMLSYQNCMRGGGIEASRFYQEEERNRKSILRDLYVRQGLSPKAAYTPLVSDDGLGIVTLDTESYSGLDQFLFLPYRQMTDDELLGYVIFSDTGDPADYGSYAGYETQLRLELGRVLGAPLAMTLENEGMSVMGDFNVAYGDEPIYYATLVSPEGVLYYGYLNVDTNKVISALMMRPNSFQYSDLYLDPFDERWLTVAKDAVLQLREDDMVISAAESRGETGVQYAGYGAMIDVIMEDGSHYRLAIPYQTGTVGNWIDYDTSTLDPDQLYAMMYEE